MLKACIDSIEMSGSLWRVLTTACDEVDFLCTLDDGRILNVSASKGQPLRIACGNTIVYMSTTGIVEHIGNGSIPADIDPVNGPAGYRGSLLLFVSERTVL